MWLIGVQMYNTFDRSRISVFFENLGGLIKRFPGLKRANDDTIMQREAKKELAKDNTSRIAKKMDQELAISSISVGILTGGALFYAPLSLVALPGLCYQSLDLALKAFDSLKNKNQVNRAFLDLLVFALCLSQGYYVLGSLALSSHYFTNKILFKSNKDVSQSLSEAVGKEPSMTWLLKDGIEIEIPTNTLQKGQSVVIHPGELVPVDGLITDGLALVDEHVLSGSAAPTIKNIGESVTCGNILLAGRIVVQIKRVGDGTCMAKMAAQLTQATENQTTLQHWSQKLSPIVSLSQLVGGGLASFMFGPMSVAAMMGARSDYDQIASLELATWLEEGLQNGIFIRNTQALELLKQVDTMVIDHAIKPLSAEERTQLVNQLRRHKITCIDPDLTDMTMQEKVKLLTQLQADGATVCYIGDTITQDMQEASTVSIGLSHIASTEDPLADIVLLDGTLQQVDLLLNMAKEFNRHKKKTFLTSISPSLLALSAPFLFKSGLIVTIVLNQIGLFSGLKQAQRTNHSNE